MEENMFNDFLIGKWKWIIFVIGVFFIMVYVFCVCSGGIDQIKLNILL